MRKIKVDGKVYEVNSGELRRYNGYLYKGQLYEHEPLDTYVVGYITEEGENIGVCKKSWKHLLPVLYAGIGVMAVCTVAFGVFVFNEEYHVTPWTQTFADGGDGSGELDDGMAKGDRKFSYSRYATYDGEYVSLLYDTSYSNAEVALKIKGEVTEFRNIKEASIIPMSFSLENEEVVEGVLMLRRGSEVEEYPLAVERLKGVEQIQLALGTDSDREAGYRQMTSDIVEAGHYEEPANIMGSGNDGNLNLSAYTDDGVNIDFASFDVIIVKRGPDGERLNEDDNSTLDVLNRGTDNQ